MVVTETGRIFTFVFLLTLPVLFGKECQIPDVSIRPLKPFGIIVSIEDIPKMNYFEFQGRVNEKLKLNDLGHIMIEEIAPKNGFWTGEDQDVELKIGDVIHYFIHVGFMYENGCDKENLSYTVRELFDLEQPLHASTSKQANMNHISNVPTKAPPSVCVKTVTKVNSRSSGSSKTLCSNQIIFEDHFDTLREDYWTIEQYIPTKPDYPFVSYQRTSVSVKDGILCIEPKLQEKLPGFDRSSILSGNLDLSKGCTRLGSCMYKSRGPQILHPIASGRITSSIAFTFKYGIVEVKAKVPQGDWLYPDILLEPLSKYYGAEDERVLRIAGALGNVILTKGSEECGNKVLYGGPMIDIECRSNFLAKKISTTEWGNDFHVYSVIWKPEMIILLVDNQEWGRIDLTVNSLRARLPKDTCKPLRTLLESRKAPFDEFFGITLGVSAGGIIEFPDHVISGTIKKPWKNTESRARLKFHNTDSTWLPTWTQSALLVDYVKVRAL